MLYACSIKKYIPEEKRLYTGATINLDADSTVQKVSELKTDLKTVLRPKPNTKFLGMHLGLYYYYKNQKENPGFVNKWLFKQFGQKPVYQSDVETYEMQEILRNRLENHGFFYSRITSSFTEKEKEASVTYSLKVPEPYRMETYQIDSMVSPIYNDVLEASKDTPFKKNMRFSLSNLKQERQRLDIELK